jgi:hypothetical protein
MTITEGPGTGADGQAPEARIFLQPIAAPSVLGYFALASGGLIIFGTWLAGSWGSSSSYTGFFEFVLLFAGIGQLAAALWSYRARDAVAASIHGAWAHSGPVSGSTGCHAGRDRAAALGAVVRQSGNRWQT